MPLPANGSVWPPEHHKTAYGDYEVFDAWYAGNVEALETLYSTTRLVTQGGLWGQAKRFFMGTPNPGNQSQRPVKIHVPLPAAIARMSSSLLWGEMPNITVGDGDGDLDDTGLTPAMADKINTRISELLDDSAHAQFLEQGEIGSALGGAFLRVSWDMVTRPDAPFLTAVAPDAAVPDFNWGRLTGVTFWFELAPLDGQPGIWRLLERHEPGSIEWGLYCAKTTGELGMRFPLTEHPAAESLARVVNEDSSVETGTNLLTAAYIPNVKPNRLRRKDPVCSNLGRSDFSGVDQLFDALNETITSWQRDIRLGKARVLIDRELLSTNKAGEGATFNADQEFFTPLNGSGGLPSSKGSTNASGGNGPIEQVQFKIRVQEHSDTAMYLLEQIFAACGYSQQTFGYQSAHAARTVTATEVDSREHMTMLTRASKIMYARPQVQQIIAALLDVDRFVFNGPGRGQALPKVEFPDAATPSMDALATTLQLLAAAEAASTEVKVAMLHPDWDEADLAVEVARIKAEHAVAPPITDPFTDNGSVTTDGGTAAADDPAAGDTTGNG